MTKRTTGAEATALWRTKEGWVVQVRAMSDFHLMNLLMMLLNSARRVLYLELQNGIGELTTPYAVASDAEPIIVEVVAELRARRILDKLPESF